MERERKYVGERAGRGGGRVKNEVREGGEERYWKEIYKEGDGERQRGTDGKLDKGKENELG